MAQAEVGEEGVAVDAELHATLCAFQDLIWSHPVAFQRAFAALVREGRAFARTAEGAELRSALERSPVFARSRMIWDVLSMSAFVDSTEDVLPSVFVDALARAADSADLEPILARVFKNRM